MPYHAMPCHADTGPVMHTTLASTNPKTKGDSITYNQMKKKQDIKDTHAPGGDPNHTRRPPTPRNAPSRNQPSTINHSRFIYAAPEDSSSTQFSSSALTRSGASSWGQWPASKSTYFVVLERGGGWWCWFDLGHWVIVFIVHEGVIMVVWGVDRSRHAHTR